MATPFAISLMPASVRQAWPFIEAGVSRGLSSAQITRTIQAGGIKTSASSVLQGVRLQKRLIQKQTAALKAGINKPINPSNLPIAITNIKRNLSFEIQLNMLTTGTGKLKKRFITVSTDNLRFTPEQLIDEAMDMMNNREGCTGEVALSGTVIGGKRSPSFSFK